MRPKRWGLVATLLPALGCTTTTAVHRPPTPAEVAEINRSASTNRLEVMHEEAEGPVQPLTIRQLSEARVASVDLERMTIVAPDKPPLVLPTDRVRSVSVVSHKRGMADGAGAGITIAILAGVVGAVLSAHPDPECIGCQHNNVGFGWAWSVGVYTVPIGTLLGALAGHRDVFALGQAP